MPSLTVKLLDLRLSLWIDKMCEMYSFQINTLWSTNRLWGYINNYFLLDAKKSTCTFLDYLSGTKVHLNCFVCSCWMFDTCMQIYDYFQWQMVELKWIANHISYKLLVDWHLWLTWFGRKLFFHFFCSVTSSASLLGSLSFVIQFTTRSVT